MRNNIFLDSKKKLIILICTITICAISAGSIFAYLLSSTNKLKNTFEPGIVSCKVDETFDGVTKSNVCIVNTGNVDAYIRASVLINWVNRDGAIYGASTPVEGVDYIIEYGDQWRLEEDGYFYYEDIVNPNEETPILIEECTEINENSPDGYSLHVEIIASAVQADPNKTEETWGELIQ